MKFNFKFNYICHLWEAAFIDQINKVQDQEYNAPFGFLRTGACAPAVFQKKRQAFNCLPFLFYVVSLDF